MKILFFILLVCTISISCTKKHTYTCEIVKETNIGAGVKITSTKKFRGTYEQMLEYEKNNTNATTTTTCH